MNMTDTFKSPGQIAYETELAAWPLYHDGAKRRTWDRLGEIERLSWERNPTPRKFSKPPTEKEQK